MTKKIFIFYCFLLTHCLNQAQKPSSAENVCQSLRQDILNLSFDKTNEAQQGRPGKIGPRGFPGPIGPKGQIGPQGQCTCDPRDVEQLRSSLRNMEGKKITNYQPLY